MHFRREVVGTTTKQRFDVWVVFGATIEARALGAHAVGELQRTAIAPRVADVDGGVDGIAFAAARLERARVLRRNIRREVSERIEREGAELIV